MLNLVIAFVMEIYNTINEDLEAEYNRRDYVFKLQQKFQNVESAEQMQRRDSWDGIAELSDKSKEDDNDPATSDDAPHFF